jgi:hypothetical protein
MNEAESAACTSCGLLLLKVQPRRRAEDLAVQRRRTSDRESATCRFCSGDVAPEAIRCRHCSEVLNEDFYRERAYRVRSRINYASWVLYLFGLGALLVFRPVGMVSIACGLLLSIAYYAIAVDPPPSRGGKKRGFLTVLKRQLRLDRVEIALPAARNHKLVFVGTPLVAALVGYMANVILLQEPVDDILKRSAAFQGMQVSAHYGYWLVPGVVVYDLEDVTIRQTPIDVHTAFLEFAKELKERRFSRVDLSYRGEKRFAIDGASFAKLGDEYSKRNFDYVLYSFPRLLHAASGVKPIDPKSSDRDALVQFHKRWYGDDPMTRR